MKNTLTKFFCIISFISVSAQDLSQEYLDTLGDEELLSLYDELSMDSIKAEQIARVYLNRAKQLKDTIKMARGYDRLSRIFSPQRNISFADSIISITRSSDHITYPALGYIIKAFEYSKLIDLKQEYENLLLAYEMSIEKENLIQQSYILNRMIYTQSNWGNAKSALNLQHRRDKLINAPGFLSEIHKSARPEQRFNVKNLYAAEIISSLECFVFCHLNLKEYDSAYFYINKLKKELPLYNGYQKKHHEDWAIEASMEVDYFLGDYFNSIKNADSLFSRMDSISNQTEIKNLFLFKGLSNKKLKNDRIALKFFLKSDSIFEISKDNINHHYDRLLFDNLYSYYSGVEDVYKSIEYLDKILFIDSLLKINYQYFEPEHIQRFKTPLLIKEKESLILSLTKKNKRFKAANLKVLSFLILCILLLVYYFNRQLTYKKRFVSLLKKMNTNGRIVFSKDYAKTEISPQVVDEILYRLNEFEQNKEYLSNKLSLQSLAKKFQTNSNYLSRVINLKMEKNFPQYLHDLRIEYSMNELLSNSKFRNYTIKAIAEDCGYTNAESYSRAFYKKNGIYPSYYIKKLNQKTI